MTKNKIGHNIVERVTFGFGLIVMFGLLAYLGYNMTQHNDRPPDVYIISTHQPSMKHYVFKIDVRNDGQQTAEAVNIKFGLYQNGLAAAEATLLFDYVPVDSEQTAWLTFYKKHNATDSLVIESVTFVKP